MLDFVSFSLSMGMRWDFYVNACSEYRYTNRKILSLEKFLNYNQRQQGRCTFLANQDV